MERIPSPQDRQFYRDQGYLVLGPLVDVEELERIRGLCDELIETGVGCQDGNQRDLVGAAGGAGATAAAVPQLLFPSRYAPEIRETRCWERALDIAMELLEPDGCERGQLVVRDHIIVKPPGSTSPTPWHQDEAYWKNDLEYNELSIWIGLQDVTEKMGCMQFIPASHGGPVYPHHPWKQNPAIVALEIDDGYVNDAEAVACPVAGGGATVHHSRTLHFTSGNSSETPRRALILTIGTPPTKLAKPREDAWNRDRRVY
jgi:hypothetical protein